MKASAIRGTAARKIYAASVAVCLILVLILTLSLPPLTPPGAAAQSFGEYFKISYNPAVFSNVDIYGNEVFTVTIHGTATCIQNTPLTVREGSITCNVTAVNSVSGHQVTLQSNYTVDINPFPSNQGDKADMTVTVPLQFPASAEAGQYNVIAKTVKAEVNIFGGWLDVTDYVPASEVLGDINYSLSNATPVPTPTIGPTSTPAAGNTSKMVLNVSDAGISSWDIDDNGVLLQDINVNSASGDVRLHIPAGTKALGADSMPLTELTVMTESAPPPTDKNHIIVAAFNFTPAGATFTPYIEITIAYDPDRLPSGTNEANLKVAYFDEDRGEWEFIIAVNIDTENHTATFLTSHFTVFAVLAPVGTTADTGVDTGSTTDVLLWIIIGCTSILGLALVILVLKRLQISSRRTVKPNRNRPGADSKE